MTSPDVELLWAELEELAWSHERRGAVGGGLAVSDHAVLRYRERVERIPRVRARRRLQDLASGAVWQDVPREWMTVVLHPGTHYGYPSGRPDVCLLEREGFVVTVMSDRFLRQQERTTRGRGTCGRDSRQRR